MDMEQVRSSQKDTFQVMDSSFGSCESIMKLIFFTDPTR